MILISTQAFISIQIASRWFPSLDREGQLTGVATDLRELDTLLGGLHNSDLVILAGRPAMGENIHVPQSSKTTRPHRPP